MALNARQTKFVAEYLKDLNATQAALRAGYSKSTAAFIGAENLKKPQIAAAVSQALEKRAQRTEITQDRVLYELARLAFSNMLDYIRVQPDGSAYTDLSQLTREQAAAIQEITVDEYTEGRGDDAREVKRTKVKLADKRGNLELIGRHLGMFNSNLGSKENPLTVQADPALIEDSRSRLLRLLAGNDPATQSPK